MANYPKVHHMSQKSTQPEREKDTRSEREGKNGAVGELLQTG